MSSGESPVVARRRVRVALREAREAKGYTQGQVAEAMEWSLSKVMRIESGEVSITTNDLRPLLGFLGVVDKDRVDELVREARISRSRQQQWWDVPRYREHLTPALRLLAQYECDATVIRSYSTVVIPGPLQTRGYAEAILSKWADDLTPDDREIRLEARIRRREQLLARTQGLTMFLLLDQSVLYREVGGARVLGGQLADLLSLTEEHDLRIRVVPYTVDAPLTVIGSYDLLYLGEDDDHDNAIMYRESLLTDEIVEDATRIARHRAGFDQWWHAAEDEQTSARHIRERIDHLASGDPDSPG